ncbi:MAG: T9SS type A sorting domain-containing protein [candidate division KSB1 bacterium]|nr:T9SS type A sorting domain-containing protein [candidate division KSB1 bacterium]
MRQHRSEIILRKQKLPAWLIAIALIMPLSPVSAQTLVETRLASEAGGAEGIFIRITPPTRARYSSLGAPVIIHVAGGFGSNGLTVANPPWSLPDCIEIRFNFPGGGSGATLSGGAYDDRGPNCLKTLRDVIRFALGTTADANGKKLSQLVNSIVPLASNVGLVGWSNGGNATLGVAGVHGGEIAGLAWIVNWESPVGDGMANLECGALPRPGVSGQNPAVNPAYNPDTGEFDLSLLAYSDTVNIAAQGPALRGGLYFDINRNGIADLGVDFILRPHLWRVDNVPKVYYSNRVIAAASAANLLPMPLPAHIASVAETGEFWHWRDDGHWFAEVVRQLPNLMFIVEAAAVDHLQTAPDHPHVLIQYEGMRRAGARFVRLNPDRAYVESVLGRSAATAADNEAFTPFDHLSIRNALEPVGAGGVPTNAGVAAAIYELADRTQYGNLSPQLGGVLTSVKEKEAALPAAFALAQNYPNPFNPSTVISVQLSVNSHVTLKVFDVTGREVATLVQGNLEAGNHSVTFAPRDLAGGIYFYQLTAGKFSQTRKAISLR